MCNRSEQRVTALLAAALIGAFSLGCDRSASVVAKSSAASTASTASTASAASSLERVVPEALVEATFDDLKFEMEAGAKFEQAMLTPKVQSLFDRQIRIRGYIYPTLKKRGIKQFVLVRDNLECCFGPGAALFDCILVHMQEGKTAEFSIRPVAVEGKFLLEEFLDYDGTVRAIYRLDGESVE